MDLTLHHAEPHHTPPTTSKPQTNSSQHSHFASPSTQNTQLTSPHSPSSIYHSNSSSTTVPDALIKALKNLYHGANLYCA